jgi:pimeloyl-ACP methyl ester carboxylesterase
MWDAARAMVAIGAEWSESSDVVFFSRNGAVGWHCAARYRDAARRRIASAGVRSPAKLCAVATDLTIFPGMEVSRVAIACQR